MQVSDRWHLWKNLCEKPLAEVRSHSACWATANTPRPAGVHERTTRERRHQIHDLLGKGVGLLECARRLNLSLNTVKRYARTRALRRAPRYRPTLFGPYRDHLRGRRAADPAVPVKQLFREVQEQGYTGSFNLLYRYITQGRAEGDRPVTTPQRLARLLLTYPDHLRDRDTSLLAELTASCPGVTQLASFTRSSPRGSSASARPSCPTSTPLRTVSNSTVQPSTPASPSRTTMGGPKTSTPAPNES